MKLWRVGAALAVCTFFFGADSLHGTIVEQPTFQAPTDVEVRHRAVLHVKSATTLNASGWIDGTPVQGTILWAGGTDVTVDVGTRLHFFQGSAIPDGLSESTADLAGFLLLMVTLLGGFGVIAKRFGRPATGAHVARSPTRRLPTAVREDWEEWSTWIQDMRDRGLPKHEQLIELASIAFVAVPRLALALMRFRRPNA